MSASRHSDAAATQARWQRANHKHLLAALATVRRHLQARAHGDNERTATKPHAVSHRVEDLAADMDEPPSLVRVAQIFGLSEFERDVLLLCAGVELEGDFPELCAKAQGAAERPYATFGLALAALPKAVWASLTPEGPLRYWKLVELQPGGGLTHAPLRIDERILHILAGIDQPDERIAAMSEPLPPAHLVPSHHALAARILATWTLATDIAPPVVQLCGDESSGKRAIAAEVSKQLWVDARVVSAAALPSSVSELDTLVRLVDREAALGRTMLVLDCDGDDTPEAGLESRVHHLADRVRTRLVVLTRHRRRFAQRMDLAFEVGKPTREEQENVWREAVSQAGGHGAHVGQLADQFNLTVPSIRAACASALGVLASTPDRRDDAGHVTAALSNACREQARPKLDDLAHRIVPRAGWQDLILPASQEQMLRDIAIQVRHRTQVYEAWGFSARSARGFGISALFSGSSGTGKTLSAEVLANHLGLDLYRIDLSAVVSKYIGETEKNLRRVFDGAEEGGAILLFDEADALFGKRSEVKDSHDRHANIEVSYLLQRMEEYRGLAVLTTNAKEALDVAFLRRLRFNVHFPFPDEADRARIWARIFPPQTPTLQLDPQKLARLSVAGGNIRNIALNAAFAAAEANEPVQMRHVLRAARLEYGKLDQALSESEIRGWI
jgi:hypothetical protein